MKVNIIIRIEDCDDTEQAIESKFSECETASMLEKESLKLLHPIVKKYVETFTGEVAEQCALRGRERKR